jgi:hypothetical protein
MSDISNISPPQSWKIERNLLIAQSDKEWVITWKCHMDFYNKCKSGEINVPLDYVNCKNNELNIIRLERMVQNLIIKVRNLEKTQNDY